MKTENDHATIVLALAKAILELIIKSGATEEEGLAALRSSEAILPTLELESDERITIRT